MAASSEPRRHSGNSLFLGDEVYFCVTEGQGIFLDLKQDDYSAIPVPSFDASADSADGEAAIRDAFEAHRQDLLDSSLLSEAPEGRPDLLAFRFLQQPALSVFHPDDERAFGVASAASCDVRIGARDVVDVLSACRRASSLLRKQHIHEIVSEVRSRKAGAQGNVFDLEALVRNTALFRKLRPWYGRDYLCLFEALALVEFLARKGLFPVWVFGVQAQPFAAHCWVQTEEHLLNDSLEFAGQFTPIMAV